MSVCDKETGMMKSYIHTQLHIGTYILCTIFFGFEFSALSQKNNVENAIKEFEANV